MKPCFAAHEGIEVLRGFFESGEKMKSIYSAFTLALAFAASNSALVWAADTVSNSADKSDLYVGVLLGASSTSGRLTNPIYSIDDTQNDGVDRIGAVLGWRMNHDDWIWGAEADANFALNGSLSPYDGVTGNFGNGHLRALVGRNFGNLALYVAGGAALGSFALNSNSVDNNDINQIHLGWTAGIGAEVNVTQNIALRAEFLHDDYNFAPGASYNQKWSENTVRAGAIFKF